MPAFFSKCLNKRINVRIKDRNSTDRIMMELLSFKGSLKMTYLNFPSNQNMYEYAFLDI
jgi:hypothetical protein